MCEVNARANVIMVAQLGILTLQMHGEPEATSLSTSEISYFIFCKAS